MVRLREDKKKNKNLWQDKLDFSAKIVDLELRLVSKCSAVINAHKYHAWPMDRLEKLEEFTHGWAIAHNLYDILKADYEHLLEDDEQEKLKIIMDKYSDWNERPTVDDLMLAKDLLLRLMSMSGFHDLIRRADDDISPEEAIKRLN